MAKEKVSFRKTPKGRFCKALSLFCPESSWELLKSGKYATLSQSTNDEGTTFINEVETIELDLTQIKVE